MNWNAVENVNPPKDRVIIVTGGFCWKHTDIHFPLRPARKGRGRNGEWETPVREEYTARSWSIAGNISYAIWFEDEDEGESFWIDAVNGAKLPPFQFWAEANNPFKDHDMVSEIPPHGLTERFDGDARLAEHNAKIEKEKVWIAVLENKLEDATTDFDKGVLTNNIEKSKKALEEKIKARDRSYDPYSG